MDRKQIFEDYSGLISGIFHYQNQQIEIKIIGLKIILGTFAIIGLLFFANINLSNIWLIIFCSIIPFFSLIFITGCFFQDLIYKEKLKLSFFLEAQKLEKENKWLFDFHNCLLVEENSNFLHSIPKQIVFYLGNGGVLIVISMFLFCFLIKEINMILISIIIGASFLFYIFYAFFLSYHVYKTKKMYVFEKHEKKIGSIIKPNEFTALLHAKGKEFIEHFSSLKMRYKNLTVILLSAIFISIAYVVSSQSLFFESNNNLLSYENHFIRNHILYFICFFTLLIILGIRLIRHLDISISHEQVRSVFRYVINMEKKIKSLSKPYLIISEKLYNKGFDPIIFDFFFYSSIIIGIVFFSLVLIISNKNLYYSITSMILAISFVCSFLILEILSFIKINKMKF